MIYTVTLNPALDYTIQVNHLKLGKMNRTSKEELFAGGKGINVSWILNELGIVSTALGFTAGFTGKHLCSLVQKQGIKADFIHVNNGMTRINVKIKSDQESEINGLGPVIEEDDFNQLCLKIQKLKDDDILILSGSIPSCMPEDTYEILLSHLSSHVHIIVDAENKLLLNCLKYHPFLIKPNKEELEAIFNKTLHSEKELLCCAKQLQSMGAKNVLISMAEKGALLLDETQTVHRIGAAEGTLVNSVGAGDSMTAGFIAGWLKTNCYKKALLLATACGGATAFSSGLADRYQIISVLNALSEQKQLDLGGLLK